MNTTTATLQPPTEPGDVQALEFDFPQEARTILGERPEPHLNVYVSLDGETWEEPISWPSAALELEAVDVRGVPCFKGHLSRAMFLAAVHQERGHILDPDDLVHGWARYIRDFKSGTTMLMLEESAGKAGAFRVTYDRRRWEGLVPHAFNATTRKAQAEALEFNDRHAVGQAVRFWKGRKAGDGQVSRTRTEAQVLGGHTAVVWLRDAAGCVALSHVEPLELEDGGGVWREVCQTCGHLVASGVCPGGDELRAAEACWRCERG